MEENRIKNPITIAIMISKNSYRKSKLRMKKQIKNKSDNKTRKLLINKDFFISKSLVIKNKICQT